MPYKQRVRGSNPCTPTNCRTFVKTDDLFYFKPHRSAGSEHPATQLFMEKQVRAGGSVVRTHVLPQDKVTEWWPF